MSPFNGLVALRQLKRSQKAFHARSFLSLFFTDNRGIFRTQLNIYYGAGFELVKQNLLAKISECSVEKKLPQAKNVLDLQIIL